ncbi:MAG: cell division protein FtsA [Flavobacteriales bacterium]|jgi:cell division protein FtsA|nr:cell division protein FtsA [Flavobacteriales bacterium]MDP7430589.1 cell division protein FtsA [Flavobacteriales bacterium]HJN64259.1 cell division protein FtsA [Flavobacteriales bacterium]|tara:strand:- start:2330 stop:3601 length:1272 start_codon:yes stop_codon:yes gene_type:complete
MENNSPIIVGLDIGTTKISVMVGRKDQFGKLEILGMGKAISGGVLRGIVANIDKTVESIKLAVEEAEQKSGAEIDEVYIGIAGQHIKSLQHRGEMVRDDIENEITIDDMEKLRENMFKLVTVPGEEVIHVIPQEYTVDGEDGIQNPKGMAGIKLEANFHIITAQVAAVRNIIRCIKKAGLNARELILEPFASAIATLDSDELNEGVALVDIGGGTTDVAIFLEGIIRHTAVIPFGGNIITKDIKTGLSILEKQAELLKVKFGSAMHTSDQDNVMVSIPGLRGREPKEISTKNLAEIIGARMKEIIDLVYHEIKVSGFENKLMTGIVLTGGGAQLRALPQLVSYITGKDIRVGLPNEHLGKESHGKVTSPMYSTGVGLVLKGFEDLEVEVIWPDETGKKQKPKVGGILSRLKELLAEFFEEDVT